MKFDSSSNKNIIRSYNGTRDPITNKKGECCQGIHDGYFCGEGIDDGY